MTTTPIYLVVANKASISFNKLAFFSKAEAYQHIAQLNINEPEYTYIIQTLAIVGD